jgi:hypothetical protein
MSKQGAAGFTGAGGQMETKRGRVLRDTNIGPGLVTVEGRQYSFTLEDMWVSEVPPRPGMVVAVTFNGDGAPSSLQAIPQDHVAGEQAQRARADARRQGAAVPGEPGFRFGQLAVLAEALLLISFFLLPNLRVGNRVTSQLLNGWDAIGLDPATAATNNHGFLSLLALGLFAPLAVPLFRRVWSRWLYAAPFGFACIAAVSLSLEIANTSRAASQVAGSLFGERTDGQFASPAAGMFSPGIGAFLVLICSLYLLSRTFRSDGSP